MPVALSQFTTSLLGLKSRIKTGSDSPSCPYTSSSPDTALTAYSIESTLKFKATETIITIVATLSFKKGLRCPSMQNNVRGVRCICHGTEERGLQRQ